MEVAGARRGGSCGWVRVWKEVPWLRQRDVWSHLRILLEAKRAEEKEVGGSRNEAPATEVLSGHRRRTLVRLAYWSGPRWWSYLRLIVCHATQSYVLSSWTLNKYSKTDACSHMEFGDQALFLYLIYSHSLCYSSLETVPSSNAKEL